MGLDRLWHCPWPQVNLRLSAGLTRWAASIKLDSQWVLLLPLAFALRSAYNFDQSWMLLYRLPLDQPAVVARLKALVPPCQTQWVQTPWNDNAWIPPAMDAGLKLAAYFRPWHWQQRVVPQSFAEAERLAPPTGQVAPVQPIAGLSFSSALTSNTPPSPRPPALSRATPPPPAATWT